MKQAKRITPLDFHEHSSLRFGLQLYVEAANDADAKQLAQIIQAKLQAVCGVADLQVCEPYWKIPTYYGLHFSLAPQNTEYTVADFYTLFNAVVSLTPTDWTFGPSESEHSDGYREAIWNPSENAPPLLAPEVRWALLTQNFPP